ncbi:YbhB/YbcL family Raf kinase inhibitor-like protein [Persephonella sp.]
MINIECSAVGENGFIFPRYTCDGDDVSPEIKWSSSPDAVSYLILVEDPDAPLGVFTHWIVYDIPPDITGLPENIPKTPEINGIKQGINDFGRIGYNGPCPPFGKPHRYIFSVYALDVPSLELPAGASRQEIEIAVTGKIVDEGHIKGYYGR